MKKKIMIVLTCAMLILLVNASVRIWVEKTKEPNIEQYKESLNKVLDAEIISFSVEEKVYENLVGETEIYKQYETSIREFYRDKENHFQKVSYEERDDIYFYLQYDDTNYAYENHNGMIEYVKYNNITPFLVPIDSSYFFIDDKNVEYEETSDSFIVTYVNEYRNGEFVSGLMTEPKYTYAVSEAYFDKEWNLQKIKLIEKCNRVDEDGNEYERTYEKKINFNMCSVEEIKKVINDEYQYVQSTLD